MNQDTYVPGYEPQGYTPITPIQNAQAPWSLLGNTQANGFQLGDLGTIGQNLWSGAQQGFSSLNTNPQLDYLKKQLGQGFTDNYTNVPDANKFGNIMGGLQTIGGLYSGYKQLNMANKQFDMQKDMWNKSWDAAKKNTNESLEYRSLLRNNNNKAKSKEDMKKYSI